MLNKKVRNDIILIVAVLILAISAFAVFLSSLKDGQYVIVSVNGEEKYRYSLTENTEFSVNTGENGENINHIVIKDKKVYINKADCRDKICVNHRAISKSGETIVCLPHKVVVSIGSK